MAIWHLNRQGPEKIEPHGEPSEHAREGDHPLANPTGLPHKRIPMGITSRTNSY